MTIHTTYNEISRSAWTELLAKSDTGNWFQTAEAYDFFVSLPEMFIPFVVAVSADGTLRGVCVGYITKEKNPVKQWLTRRAIIVGGPALANDCTNEEVAALMHQVKAKNKELGGAIYIETRNFNDYSRWREGFEKAGFVYEEHLNFHVDTHTTEIIEQHLGKNRKRDIKTSFRDGATIIEKPTIKQVRDFYLILQHLYQSKIKTPLFPLTFFERLYENLSGRFLLVEYHGEIIGGTVCVIEEGRCLYEWFVAGRDGEWKTIFPSSVATYAGIRYAAEHGCTRFDMMGAGTPAEAYGVRDFKARFGGELVEHGRYKYICKPLLYKCGELGVKLLKGRK